MARRVLFCLSPMPQATLKIGAIHVQGLAHFNEAQVFPLLNISAGAPFGQPALDCNSEARRDRCVPAASGFYGYREQRVANSLRRYHIAMVLADAAQPTSANALPVRSSTCFESVKGSS